LNGLAIVAYGETLPAGYDFIAQIGQARVESPRVETVFEEILSGTWEEIISTNPKGDDRLWRKQLELPLEREWLILTVDARGERFSRRPSLAASIAGAWPSIPPLLPNGAPGEDGAVRGNPERD
jgi:hypothetical protein